MLFKELSQSSKEVAVKNFARHDSGSENVCSHYLENLCLRYLEKSDKQFTPDGTYLPEKPYRVVIELEVNSTLETITKDVSNYLSELIEQEELSFDYEDLSES